MLAAFFTTGVMMPFGYEWGYRRKIDVAKSTPQDQEQTGIDISSQIAEVNQLRRRLPPLNVEGVQKRLSQPDDPVLVLLRGDDHHLQRSRYATLVFANTSEEPVRKSGATLVNSVESFDYFVDHTPLRKPSNLNEDLTLLPKEVRIFQGGRV
jgi:starch synthase (maltosyl-transferring)